MLGRPSDVIITTLFVAGPRTVTTSMAAATHAASAAPHHQNDDDGEEPEISEIAPVHGDPPFANPVTPVVLRLFEVA